MTKKIHGMRRFQKRYTLWKWILLGCIALMIPIMCAVINFFINKDFTERKIEEANEFSLNQVRYSIDKKLSSLLEVSKYCLMDENFTIYTLNTKSRDQFLKRVRECYRVLKVIGTANPDIELMLYIPEKEYILDTGTANDLSYLYDTLASQNRISVSKEEWERQLNGEYRNMFLISDQLGYGHYGTSCFVYATSLMYSNTQEFGYLFCSVPTDFLDPLMNSEGNRDNTILILDRNNRIIGQYGAELNVSSIDLQTVGRESRNIIETDEESYIAAYTDSEVTNWKYIVCTPKRIYLAEVAANTRTNLLIIVIGAIIGVLAIVLLMRNNYRPVRQLMEILPERDDFEKDEFQVVENSLRRLYNENILMQNSVRLKEQYEREIEFLAVIKGRNNFFKKITAEELLGPDYAEKQFAFVTIRMDVEQEGETQQTVMEYDLLEFVVNNVVMELFGSEFRYMKAVDNALLVFLFLLDRGMEREQWMTVCEEKFLQLNEFFENRLASELCITLGQVFEGYEHLASAYTQILEASVYRYYVQPAGVIRSDEIERRDSSLVDSLEYYRKRFEEAAAQADFAEGEKLCNELFDYLESSGNTYHRNLYCVLSIVNDILTASRDMVEDGMIRDDAVEKTMTNMRTDESLSALKEDFYSFLKQVCRAVSTDSRGFGRLSERIREYVQDNYTDCNMNISAIADVLGLSPRYVSRVFKEQTGLTLLNYINDMRIERAKQLLKQTNKTVDEISRETGFANVRTFRRNFQKATGITASDYKK